MPDQAHDPTEHLERARDLVWEAIERLEEAQRVLFRAGDCYVAQVYGDGVRNVIEITETMADISGDLTQCHIEIRKIGKRDKGRGWTDS
ncbi:MAG TPA: hypothetical protein VK358_17965 [Longimicrobium sp.]|nr:hypothetical protein [Longimicrobium sp.]